MYFLVVGHNSSDAQCARMSPIKASRVRRSCLEDLERLKKLLEGILSEQEFSEEKEQILSTLKNLR